MKKQLKKTIFELKDQIQKKRQAETVFFKTESGLIPVPVNEEKELTQCVDIDQRLVAKCRIDVIICFKGFVFENDDQRIS